MLRGIAVLLAFQLIGEVVSFGTGKIVPGPVVGMILIAVALTVSRNGVRLDFIRRETVATSNTLLANLGLLFVPAGVGIVQHLELIRERGFALLLIIVASTVITLLATVGVFLGTKKILGGKADE